MLIATISIPEPQPVNHPSKVMKVFVGISGWRSSRNDLLDRASWIQRVSTVTGDWRKKRQIRRDAGVVRS
jgi:hypothetical protein